MQPRFQHYFLTSAFCLLVGFCQNSQAATDPAGQVMLVSGKLEAIQANQAPRLLKRGAPFYVTDTLNTADDSQAQLRFTDGTLVALRANSSFKIDQYKFDANNKSENKTVAYTVSLIKGGFRSISGEIAKTDPDEYKINTNVATIGVRGTEFSVVLDAAGGLGAATYAGRIRVKNSAGMIEIGKGAEYNYAYVASAYTPPKGEPVRPSFLLNDPQVGGSTGANQTKSSVCLQ